MVKKYNWNWTTNRFMDEDIELFIEVSKKNKNLWWQNLQPIKFFKNHKEYFKELAMNYFQSGQNIDTPSTLATAKTCPAIGNGLLNKCILIKAPCDFSISIEVDGRIFWHIKQPEMISINPHPKSQFHTEKHNPFLNKINIKFSLPIFLHMKGDTYMFLQPQFHQQNYPFEVVCGSVNKRRIHLNVNTIIDIPKEKTEYHIKAGTVLSYLWLDNKNIVLEKNEKLKDMLTTRFLGNK